MRCSPESQVGCQTYSSNLEQWAHLHCWVLLRPSVRASAFAAPCFVSLSFSVFSCLHIARLLRSCSPMKGWWYGHLCWQFLGMAKGNLVSVYMNFSRSVWLELKLSHDLLELMALKQRPLVCWKTPIWTKWALDQASCHETAIFPGSWRWMCWILAMIFELSIRSLM